ncbi:MAG TPA: response regulator [Longimicrobiales bacterium]
MSLRILIVDDNTLVAEGTAAALGVGGHRAEVVPSAEAALERHRPGAWDLVLTDIRLEGMSGWELIERLRAREPGLAVAVLSGWPPSPGEPSAGARGARFLLVKPVDPEELLRAVDVIVVAPGAGD